MAEADVKLQELSEEIATNIAQGRTDAAIRQIKLARIAGVEDQDFYWRLAQVARDAGNLPLVDYTCSIVLEISPQFWFARELPRHARGFYAQKEQDVVIESFFTSVPPTDKFFVEVGAFDGVHYSNVRRLVEQHGWSGISIEPVEQNFAKLTSSYRGKPVTCVRCAIGEKEGEAELNVSTYPHLPDWGSDVASLTEEDTERWQREYGAVWRKERVRVRTLDSILAENNVAHFDLLSVDAEGHDLEVLRGLNFRRHRPTLIVVEYGSNREEIFAFLGAHGYSLLLDNGQDLFMASLPQSLSLNGSPRKPARESASSPLTDAARSGDQEKLVATLLELERAPSLVKTLVQGEGGIMASEDLLLLAEQGRRMGCLTSARMLAQGVLAQEPQSGAARDLLRRMEGYYCDDGADLIIEEYFLRHGAPSRSFVEIGAGDGYTESKVRRLHEKHGWSGICLEPRREVFQQLSDSYAGSSVRCARARVQGPGRESDGDVPEVPFDRVLEALATATVDLLAINTPAPDSVLAGFEWQNQQPAVVVLGPREGAEPAVSRLKGLGYRMLHQGGLSLVMAKSEPETPVTLDTVASRLHPFLLENRYFEQARLTRASTGPRTLLSARRFDIPAKLIYARLTTEGHDTLFGVELYREHLAIFNCIRETAEKEGFEAFEADFRATLESIGSEGFLPNRSLLPVDPLGSPVDGAHRAAASIYHDRPVQVLRCDRIAPVYDYRWFRDRGLSEEACDAIATEYVRWSPRCIMVTLFPAADRTKDEAVLRMLLEQGDIVYGRELEVRGDGPALLIWQMYRHESWAGDAVQQWPGTRYKASCCFPAGHGVVRALLFEPRPGADLRRLKKEIRAVYAVENDSVHINDTHRETQLLASIYFNANSRHFLNNARMTYMENFWGLFTRFEAGLYLQDATPDDYCIDGSAILSAYGLRECRDLDFLHTGIDDLSFGDPDLIGSHNLCTAHHVTSRDDIIFNPANHFYFHGIRFGSLGIIAAMKNRRGEGKDAADLALIAGLPEPPPQPHRQRNQVTVPFDWSKRPPKIVGLVTVRNESAIVGQALRLLSLFTDAIVLLDDASTDDTVAVCEAYAASCRVEHIIRKRSWFRDEPGDRNRLLNAGRAIGGTHFIVTDADECFTANLLRNGFLRRTLLSLQPGEILELQWLQLWRSTSNYRDDGSIWSNSYKAVAFRDNWSSHYTSDFIHTPRIPKGIAGRTIRVNGPEVGLMHFQFTNWANLLLKQAWYRCMERIRTPEKPDAEINERYAPSKDERNMVLKGAPEAWFSGYPLFDHECYQKPDNWRMEQVLAWFARYGREHFTGLDIWDVAWETAQPREALPPRPDRLGVIRGELADMLGVRRPKGFNDVTARIYASPVAAVFFHDQLPYLRSEPLAAEFVPRSGISTETVKRLTGGPCRIGYLGASVSAQQDSYVAFLHDHLCRLTGQDHGKVVLAYGAMGSVAALQKVGQELFEFRPQICFIELLTGEMNDGLTPLPEIGPALEAIVRGARNIGCEPIFLNLYRADHLFNEKNPWLACYESVAQHYGVPSINVCSRFFSAITAGELELQQVIKDAVHTTPEGSRFVAATTITHLATLLKGGGGHLSAVPAPLFGTRYLQTLSLSPQEPCTRQFKDAHVWEMAPGQELAIPGEGYLAGIQLVVGSRAGLLEVEITASGFHRRYSTWDHWCYHGERFHFLCIGTEVPPGGTVRLRALPHERTWCGFCYHEEADGRLASQAAMPGWDALLPRETPCSESDQPAPEYPVVQVVSLFFGVGAATSPTAPHDLEDGGAPKVERSNLKYWQHMQEKGYFENQNFFLMEKFGAQEYRRLFGSSDPREPRDTSRRDKAFIAEFMALDRTMNAAVIGCGYGRESLSIAPQVKQVYGIDVSPTILKKAQEYLGSKGVHNFTPVLAQDWRSGIEAELDFVYSITVFQHLTRDLVRDYLFGLAQKLSARGRGLCQFAELSGGTTDAELKTYEPSVNWSAPEIEALVEEAGLRMVTLRTLDVQGGKWHWAFFARAANGGEQG
ncbi:FkbM family methyltransferase [Geomonas oryzae]|uniref:FkbM family methyltransferase n=1 Tax=Geomonas oryzae TaxID=2364273 RepID=UPI0013A5CCA9|nr:FkbM family methyltransferase [Geomonas oryzae]